MLFEKKRELNHRRHKITDINILIMMLITVFIMSILILKLC